MWAGSKSQRAATHCSLVWSFSHSFLQNSSISTTFLCKTWRALHIYPKNDFGPKYIKLSTTNKVPFTFSSTIIQRFNSLNGNCGDKIDWAVYLLYQINNGRVDISGRLWEYYSAIHDKSKHVHNSIIIIVLYDILLEKIALDILILPLLLGPGNKDACIYIHYLS